MGCDIHVFPERKTDEGWELLPGEYLHHRSYGIFGFLADVRNYSAVPPLAEQRGIPMDATEATKYAMDDGEWHSMSWLSMSELTAFDYDQPIEDRRVTRQTGPRSWSGGCTCQPGEGEMTTYRKFLGRSFMDQLEAMQAAGVERIVFAFDC